MMVGYQEKIPVANAKLSRKALSNHMHFATSIFMAIGSFLKRA